MATPSLTIGCATFRDFEGIWMTLESLHAHHPRVHYLVIDNAPEPCTRTRAVTHAVGGRYLHRPDLHGTSAPRDALFRLAATDWVMCIDSHVLLEPGAVQALLDWIAAHPDSLDVVGGPMVYDDGKSVSTHWRPEAPPGLWGVWDTDPRYQGTEPFEVPMQGLGLFAMRRAAWPGFHPLMRGFGGEEGYLHEKVRQRGGRALCLPALRWRHRFRHMEHGAPPPPYPLRLEDHTWNLLVGHRELGVDALPQIRDHFGQRLPAGVFEQMVAQAEKAQPWGVPADRKRLKLLGVWYTNSQAPTALLERSLRAIQRAVQETMHHDVKVATSAWRPVASNPFPCALGKPNAAPGHASIIAQIRAAMGLAGDYQWDGLVFLEHDCLYPPDYFDRMGNALASGAPVASNLDYIGLNSTGWLTVRERHEPLHQLSMRRDVALANLARAEEDCKRQGWALLEPDSGEGADRSAWARLPVEGLAPAVHVNWV